MVPTTVGALSSGAVGADFASRVVSYEPGANAAPYTDPAASLGAPSRLTGIGTPFAAAVTPFNPAYQTDQLVSIGAGGSLVLELARPVRDDPMNPFGIDLLIFGNTGYIDGAFPAGIVAGRFGSSQTGAVEVSPNGIDWTLVPGVRPDNLFPTIGYSDLTDPYATSGALESDFTRPVDPSFDATGLNFAQLVAGYAGSGGGTGVDIGVTGLAEISFVRISNAAAAGAPLQIDAVSRVNPIPTPGSILVLTVLAPAWIRRRNRRCQ